MEAKSYHVKMLGIRLEACMRETENIREYASKSQIRPKLKTGNNQQKVCYILRATKMLIDPRQKQKLKKPNTSCIAGAARVLTHLIPHRLLRGVDVRLPCVVVVQVLLLERAEALLDRLDREHGDHDCVAGAGVEG